MLPVDMVDLNKLSFEVTPYKLHKINYISIPFAFDIETTSFYNNKHQKCATMYMWQMALGEYTFYGRTWVQFTNFINKIINRLNISLENRIICLIHNLAYEFQFMKNWFKWEKIFARTSRKPMQALNTLGIDFRCSYIISGYSLKKLAENYTPIKKLDGEVFDYSKIRTWKTPLNEYELKYGENDVKILYWYWKYLYQQYIEPYGMRNCKFPLTQTSVVRNDCKSTLKKYYKSLDFSKILTQQCINTSHLYNAIKNAYSGGFTHANFLHVGNVLENVYSYDFKSSYPSVMFNSYFPITQFYHKTNVDEDTFYKDIDEYCCIIHVTFKNVTSLNSNHIISVSKLVNSENVTEDNGRVAFADNCEIWITELDFKSIEKFYDYEEMEIIEYYYAGRGYLPTYLIDVLYNYYLGKNTLKNVNGKEIEYMHCKELLNALYGMTVTDIVNTDITLDVNGKWNESENSVEDCLQDLHDNNYKFLLYQWGVWVSARSRKNLLDIVYMIGDDVVYCDTDSIKFLNLEKNKPLIEEYNKSVVELNKNAMEYYGLDDNIMLDIGIFDEEEPYSKFKTLGAKKYVCEKMYSHDQELTVSGLNKKDAKMYIENELGKTLIECFDVGMKFPKGKSGRTISSYCDEEIMETITDYCGIVATIYEKSYVHLEETTYILGISDAFDAYLKMENHKTK